MNPEGKDFGTTKSGLETRLYHIEDGKGLSADLTDYGATVVSLTFTDSKGKERDLVRGYEDAADYEESGCYFGACIGRNANRIGNAEFSLDGAVYRLAANDGKNNLHSGPDTYNKRLWAVEETGKDYITFSLNSPDMDQGFPGNLKVRMTYRTVDNRFELEYEAVSDRDTVINFTNHSFFNLNGHDGGPVFNHIVTLKAEEYTESSKALIPTGRRLPVTGTALDFTKGRRLGEALESGALPLYDDNFCLSSKPGEQAGEVYAPESGIGMKIYTDLPGMQIYTPPVAQGKGKKDTPYGPFGAVCFETQYFPDAVHQPAFKSPVYKAGEVYKTKTVYAFYRR